MSTVGKKADHMINIDHMRVVGSNERCLWQLSMQFSHASAYRQPRSVHTMDTCIAAVSFQAQDLCWLEYRLPCRNGNAEALTTPRHCGTLPTRNIASIRNSLFLTLRIIRVGHGRMIILVRSSTGPPK